MSRFARYCYAKQWQEFAELCIEKGVSLAPLEASVERICTQPDLNEEETYNELLGAVGNFIGGLPGMAMRGMGNLVGRGVGFVQNMGQNLAQGAQNGYAAQTGQPELAAGAQAAAPVGGQPTAPATPGADPQAVMQQAQSIQQMLGQVTPQLAQAQKLLQQLTGTVQKMGKAGPAAKPRAPRTPAAKPPAPAAAGGVSATQPTRPPTQPK
jgi:hypothetical protein